MRRVLSTHRILPAVAVLTISAAVPVAAQTQQASAAHQHDAPAQAGAMSPADIERFAKLEFAIGNARDTAQAKLAMTRNKKDEIQQALRDSLNVQIAGILSKAGTTDAQYRKTTYYISTNGDARRIFDEAMAKLTGAPLPGVVASAPVLKVPAGDVGMHIGHVINSMGDTPNKESLIAIANAEARVAVQHANLGARQPMNLDYMKTHAGHVLNALDPKLAPMGPGAGYGLKRAAEGIQTHINLAAKATGASQNVIVHANHIATSAKNTELRADSAIVLCQKIQASTSAADAASLMNQLVSLTARFTPGFDANGDGRIGWQEGEGGLQQAEEHVKLMLAGEGLPAPDQR